MNPLILSSELNRTTTVLRQCSGIKEPTKVDMPLNKPNVNRKIFSYNINILSAN